IVELRLQPYSPDIFTGKILFNNQLITGRVTEESIEFDIPYEALTKSSFMDLIVSDRAGNTSSYKVDQDDVLKEADSLIEELGIPKNKNRLDQVLGVAQLDLAFNIESLSINSVINLSIIVFLIILLLVDFSILYKHNNIHPHRVGHHHLKIGAFIVVAMFILAASGVGSVLDGIQI
ncbi:hypothetical protein KC717_05865, partial [Candidatus Dojkabacteria bacterium]|nr:hypothetical protein [Candidatus Dojkabacteria bacterium]